MPLTLKQWREIAGLTQTDLARELTVTVGHICNLESGASNPSHKLALRSAEVLRECRMRGLSVEDIVFPSDVEVVR